MIKITHGIPKHSHFCIALPENEKRRNTVKQTPEFKLNDPVNHSDISVKFLDMWHFPINEMPDMFCRLTYGRSSDDLQDIMLSKYPELNMPGKQIEFWLLEKLD